MVYDALISLFSVFFGSYSHIDLIAQIGTIVISLFFVFLFVRLFTSKNINKWFFVAFVILTVACSLLYILDWYPSFLSGGV